MLNNYEFMSILSDAIKKAGSDIANEAKRFGENISDGSQKAWDDLNSNQKELVANVAEKAAMEAKNSGASTDYHSCMTIVSAAISAWGAGRASSGDVVGAALTAGGGYPAAHLACSRIFSDAVSSSPSMGASGTGGKQKHRL